MVLFCDIEFAMMRWPTADEGLAPRSGACVFPHGPDFLLEMVFMIMRVGNHRKLRCLKNSWEKLPGERVEVSCARLTWLIVWASFTIIAFSQGFDLWVLSNGSVGLSWIRVWEAITSVSRMKNMRWAPHWAV